MDKLGLGEIVVSAVAMLLLGGGLISDIGRALGDGLRSFRHGLKGDDTVPHRLASAPGASSVLPAHDA